MDWQILLYWLFRICLILYDSINFCGTCNERNILMCINMQRDNDKDHKVRLAIGNGVRAEIWREFLNRFGNIQIREFYASTEGNVGFVNYAGKVGAVGRVNFLHRVRMRTSKNLFFVLKVLNFFYIYLIVIILFVNIKCSN